MKFFCRLFGFGFQPIEGQRVRVIAGFKYGQVGYVWRKCPFMWRNVVVVLFPLTDGYNDVHWFASYELDPAPMTASERIQTT